MVFLALMAAASMATGDGKTAALDDWHAMTIIEVGEGSSPYYLRVKTGDLDGDGRADDAVLKLVCADGVLKEAAYAVTSPRDSASGQASGKRMHKPVTFVKEWGPATPQLSAVKPTYNVKKMEGSRLAADDWSPVSLSNTDGLCAATAAAATVVKSKSNITNN